MSLTLIYNIKASVVRSVVVNTCVNHFVHAGNGTLPCVVVIARVTQHAAIVHHRSKNVQVMDLGSTHGTFLNTKRIEARVPQILKCARLVFKFRFALTEFLKSQHVPMFISQLAILFNLVDQNENTR